MSCERDMISGPELARVTSCHLLSPFNRTMFSIQSVGYCRHWAPGTVGRRLRVQCPNQGAPIFGSYESHFLLQITVVFFLGIPWRLSGWVAISHVTRPMLICCGPKSEHPPPVVTVISGDNSAAQAPCVSPTLPYVAPYGDAAP